MLLSEGDWQALVLTLKLAALSTALLTLIGLPLAAWRVRKQTRLRQALDAVIALPLVLPPTVLGFYLLVIFAPDSLLGQGWTSLFGHPLPFSFAGLVMGSCIYSLPFVVQPLTVAFREIDPRLLEAAATLGCGRLERFYRVTLPLLRRGLLVAASLAFAHTLGEFGVVLMLGGSIPGQTQVVSIAIFQHVEALRYADAHRLAGFLLVLSFLVLLFVYGQGGNRPYSALRISGARP
ncbi:molybdate transport system permease protein [Pseudomonas duriflava]|uniref:Molybdenum transport system permease n=1 Tax=Pseudomonas duriflava TaxID=459528 RepID=A0A562QJ28_9PSED|nr:molybdate ABC transporter permease subunit [Pseudomonas duriflava]TWI56744.1 molybdate transport system permease protein [Pseudomonas duriflava]